MSAPARGRLFLPGAMAVARELGRIAREEDRGDNIDHYAPKVIAALKGNGTIFWALDEQPGLYGGYERAIGYAGTLRRVRNSPVWGPKLFASFRT